MKATAARDRTCKQPPERRALVALVATLSICSACGRGEAGAPGRSGAPPSAKGRTGIVACDEYFDAVDDCLEGASAERRAMLQQSADLIRQRIAGTPSEAAAKAHAELCRQALRMLEKDPTCQR
jgi:hypothetical protein